MKFQATREALLQPALSAFGAVESKSGLAILGHLLLDYDPVGRLTLTGTDLETQVIAQAPAESAGEAGRITVSAKKLVDILRLVPAETLLTMQLDDERLRVRFGSSRYTLATLPAADFPSFDPDDARQSVTLNAEQLLIALKRVEHAMANGDVRGYLNGCALQLSATHLTTVASDGHRLAVHAEAIDPPAGVTGAEHADFRILPRRAVVELIKRLGESIKHAQHRQIILVIGERSARICIDAGNVFDVTFSTRLLEGRFPDHQRVIPKEISTQITAPAAELQTAIQRIGILAESPDRALSWALTDSSLTLSGINQSQEQAEETLPVNQEGPDITHGFNGRYLTDALSVVEDEHATVKLASNAAVFTDSHHPGWMAVVMPMRL